MAAMAREMGDGPWGWYWYNDWNIPFQEDADWPSLSSCRRLESRGGRAGMVRRLYRIAARRNSLLSPPFDVPVVHSGSVDFHCRDLIPKKVRVFLDADEVLF